MADDTTYMYARPGRNEPTVAEVIAASDELSAHLEAQAAAASEEIRAKE
jgi:hypothetical protein